MYEPEIGKHAIHKPQYPNATHPIEYYTTALIDLVQNLKERIDIHRQTVVRKTTNRESDRLDVLDIVETEILTYIHNNMYHKYKKPIYKKEEN